MLFNYYTEEKLKELRLSTEELINSKTHLFEWARAVFYMVQESQLEAADWRRCNEQEIRALQLRVAELENRIEAITLNEGK